MMFAGKKRRRGAKIAKGAGDSSKATTITQSSSAKATKMTMTKTTKPSSSASSPLDLAERLLPRRLLDYMGSTAVYFPCIYLAPPTKQEDGKPQPDTYPLWGITLGVLSDLVEEARGKGLVKSRGYRLGNRGLDFVVSRTWLPRARREEHQSQHPQRASGT